MEANDMYYVVVATHKVNKTVLVSLISLTSTHFYIRIHIHVDQTLVPLLGMRFEYRQSHVYSYAPSHCWQKSS